MLPLEIEKKSIRLLSHTLLIIGYQILVKSKKRQKFDLQIDMKHHVMKGTFPETTCEGISRDFPRDQSVETYHVRVAMQCLRFLFCKQMFLS